LSDLEQEDGLEKYEIPNDLSIPDFLNRAAARESRAEEDATALPA
jgi:hypothetical protein